MPLAAPTPSRSLPQAGNEVASSALLCQLLLLRLLPCICAPLACNPRAQSLLAPAAHEQDKHQNDNKEAAERKFKEISEAYDVLSDPQVYREWACAAAASRCCCRRANLAPASANR